MSLVNRVSLFFLSALAVVLVVYSILFYSFVSRQLYEQFDQQLHSAFHVLVASIEVEADSVKWQPTEHAIGIGMGEDPEEVRWVVCDTSGHVVEHSRNLSHEERFERNLPFYGRSLQFKADESFDVPDWRLVQARLIAPSPKPADELDPDEFDELVITVAKSRSRLKANVTKLTLLVVLLPLGVWLLAAVVGRRFCRRALQPLTALADQAHGMSGQDFKQRLTAGNQPDELGQLSDSFNRLLDRLQESFDQQRRFTGNAAHELRTPLTVLQGQIEVALRRPRTSEEYQQTLETLHDETRELGQIVEALLFLARSSEEASPPDLQEIDLADWLLKYRQRWEGKARNDDLHLQIDSQQLGNATVSVSLPLLTQLLDNLVGNAFKYSAPGQPVELELHQSPEWAELWVTDHGVGIDPADREAIFKPFYRTAAARSSGVAGTGLGLAISARIATALGGTLDCQSARGAGSRFRLQLPVRSKEQLTSNKSQTNNKN